MVMQAAVSTHEAGALRKKYLGPNSIYQGCHIDLRCIVLRSTSTTEGQVIAMRHSTLQTSSTRANYGRLLGLSSEVDSPSQKPSTLSAPPSPGQADQDDSDIAASFRIGIILDENPTGLGGRANNLPTLLELNRKVIFLRL